MVYMYCMYCKLLVLLFIKKTEQNAGNEDEPSVHSDNVNVVSKHKLLLGIQSLGKSGPKSICASVCVRVCVFVKACTNTVPVSPAAPALPF